MVVLLVMILRCHGLLEVIAIFSAMAIHETAHFLASNMLGYRVTEFKLSPFGGALTVDPLFAINPQVEAIVALAGPAANLMIAGGVLYLKLLGVHNNYLTNWLILNLLISLINLIPAYPLDGGRILHAGLNRKFGLEAAAVYTRRITLTIALLVLILGLVRWISAIARPIPAAFGGPGTGISLTLIGIFIGVKYFSIKSPNLELAWRFSKSKKQLLRKKGFLDLKPIIVDQDTLLRVPLRRYGTAGYLLFYVPLEGQDPGQTCFLARGPDGIPQKGQLSGYRLIGEEQAWDYLIAGGYQTTFREAVKN
ncbi:MAG: hypothetical protein K6U80_15025 [Firmicutes bacterium]|nr:hypothetical protein [Bacillota bacterium]